MNSVRADLSVKPPLSEIPSLDELAKQPERAAQVPAHVAVVFLAQIASLQPLLLHRALLGTQHGPNPDDLLTVPQVAARLKVSEYRAYELCRQGLLKSVRLGKSVRVTPSALADYVARHGA